MIEKLNGLFNVQRRHRLHDGNGRDTLPEVNKLYRFYLGLLA